MAKKKWPQNNEHVQRRLEEGKTVRSKEAFMKLLKKAVTPEQEKSKRSE